MKEVSAPTTVQKTTASPKNQQRRSSHLGTSLTTHGEHTTLFKLGSRAAFYREIG
jgi:hypothetical protein